MCGPSVWPCTCSPLGHSQWPDCSSTVQVLAMVLCRKTSPVLTGLDKGDEVINKMLPLLVPLNTMDKKAMLQTVFLGSSVSPQQTQCFVAKACEFSSPQTLPPLHTALLSLQKMTIPDPDLKSGVREGSLAPCPFCDRAWEPWSSSALTNTDHSKSTVTYQKGGVCYCPQRTTTQSICARVHTVHQTATMISPAQ